MEVQHGAVSSGKIVDDRAEVVGTRIAKTAITTGVDVVELVQCHDSFQSRSISNHTQANQRLTDQLSGDH
jgi:hypothetical protein